MSIILLFSSIYRKKELEEEKNRLELLLRNRSDSLHHVEEELKLIGSQQWQSPEYVISLSLSLSLIFDIHIF